MFEQLIFDVQNSPAWLDNTTNLMVLHVINMYTIVFLVVCGFTDVIYKKIFNLVTLPTVAIGIALNSIASGWSGAKISILGFIIGFGLFFLAYMMGGIFGGDVKLVGAIGALQGYPFVIYASFLSAMVGGLIAIVVIILRGRLFKSLRNVARTVFTALMPGYKTELPDPKDSFKIPYGYGISVGTLITWLLFLGGVIKEYQL